MAEVASSTASSTAAAASGLDGGLLDVLDEDLLIAVVEQLPLSDLLSCRTASVRCNAACCRIGMLQVRRRSELTISLFRRFGSVRHLTVFDCEASWIPRLAATLAMLPNLTSLCLHQPRNPSGDAAGPAAERTRRPA